jgi:hypothetical protein
LKKLLSAMKLVYCSMKKDIFKLSLVQYVFIIVLGVIS